MAFPSFPFGRLGDRLPMAAETTRHALISHALAVGGTSLMGIME